MNKFKAIIILLSLNFSVLCWGNPTDLGLRDQDVTIFLASNATPQARAQALHNILHSPLGLSAMHEAEIASRVVSKIYEQGILPLNEEVYYQLITKIEVLLRRNSDRGDFLVYVLTDQRLYNSSYQWIILRELDRIQVEEEITVLTKLQWEIMFTIFWQNIIESNNGSPSLVHIITYMLAERHLWRKESMAAEALMQELFTMAKKSSSFALSLRREMKEILLSSDPLMDSAKDFLLGENIVRFSRTSDPIIGKLLYDLAEEVIPQLPQDDLRRIDLASAIDNKQNWPDDTFSSNSRNCFGWALEVSR